MAVQLMTMSEYARHRHCDEKAVRKAINENRITVVMVGTRKMIDPEVADIQWAKNTRARADSGRAVPSSSTGQGASGLFGSQAATGPENASAAAAPSAEPGYADFRARTEKANAERAERENAREAGRLVDADEILRGIFDSFRALRDKAMAVGPRAAPKCVGLGEARDIERVISEELRLAFESWEKRMVDLLPEREVSR